MVDDELLEAHLTEAVENGVEDIYNLGWASGEDFIHSKTDKGKLFTQRDSDGSYKHEWE